MKANIMISKFLNSMNQGLVIKKKKKYPIFIVKTWKDMAHQMWTFIITTLLAKSNNTVRVSLEVKWSGNARMAVFNDRDVALVRKNASNASVA